MGSKIILVTMYEPITVEIKILNWKVDGSWLVHSKSTWNKSSQDLHSKISGHIPLMASVIRTRRWLGISCTWCITSWRQLPLWPFLLYHNYDTSVVRGTPSANPIGRDMPVQIVGSRAFGLLDLTVPSFVFSFCLMFPSYIRFVSWKDNEDANNVTVEGWPTLSQFMKTLIRV